MGKYDDIINMPHHRSNTRPHMSMNDRAAQFSPFAALTGHSDAVAETARLTERKREPDEQTKAMLNSRLRFIMDNIKDMPIAEITYFKPDERKDGGKYETISEHIKKVDVIKRIIITSSAEIPLDDIVNIHMEGDTVYE